MNEEVFLMNIDRAASILETTKVKQHFGSYKGDDDSMCAYAVLKENGIMLPDITMGLIVNKNDGEKLTFKQIALWLRTTHHVLLTVPLSLQYHATVKGALE